MAAEKIAKSILISCDVRLVVFDIMSYDDMELDLMMRDQKEAALLCRERRE